MVLTEDSLEATNVGEVLEDLARKTGGSEMEVNEAYLKLLCQFRPDDVLKSLDSLTSYRVQVESHSFSVLSATNSNNNKLGCKLLCV